METRHAGRMASVYSTVSMFEFGAFICLESVLRDSETPEQLLQDPPPHTPMALALSEAVFVPFIKLHS